MQEQNYRIEELEEETGVSVRNIRYYTAEGLLPPPDARGRFALYSGDHVRRLRLIRQLKEDFLPLEVIKARLQELTEPQVAAALSNRLEPPQTPAPAPPGSAAAYIAGVMARRRKAEPPAEPAAAVQSPPMAAPVAAPLAMPTPEEAMPAAEVWRRIVLAPGVELHVRHVDEPIRQLIAFARTFFHFDSRPGS